MVLVDEAEDLDYLVPCAILIVIVLFKCAELKEAPCLQYPGILELLSRSVRFGFDTLQQYWL